MQFINLPLHAWQFCMILLIFSLIFTIIDLFVVFKFYRKIALFISSSILLIIEFLLIYFLLKNHLHIKTTKFLILFLIKLFNYHIGLY